MAAAPTEPRIFGAPAVASKPGSPFLYSVGATGQAPLTFSASGLPAGLTIDRATGILQGTTPAAGTYPVDVTVTNSVGSAHGVLTLVAGSTLAVTPPMG